MKNLNLSFIIVILTAFFFNTFADTNDSNTVTPNVKHVLKKVFSKDEIQKYCGSYVNNNLQVKNPALVDVDNDGDFDMLKFEDGNIWLYRNTSSLENPYFILENKNYDKYEATGLLSSQFPCPVFFADSDGDKDLDIFAITDKTFNKNTLSYNYKIIHKESTAFLDTGLLITIVLVLVIVLLVLLVLGK